jgi:predicted phosphodiesterase
MMRVCKNHQRIQLRLFGFLLLLLLSPLLIKRRWVPVAESLASASVRYNVLTDVERIYCLSDLHVDHSDNRKWIKQQSRKLQPSDLLIVAGDVSHRYDRLKATFARLQATGARVIFVFGNHEAWMCNDDEATSSYDKLDIIEDLCREGGVLVDPTLITNCQHPCWILPLKSWYDASLSIPQCQDLCIDFPSWPWTDFRVCDWPYHPPSSEESDNRIPKRLADYFHDQNSESIDFVLKAARGEGEQVPILTMSHFLPNQQCLPDWKDISSSTFQRDEWLDHGAPGTSSKFAKVAGSLGLQHQLDMIHPAIHIFGHSHRPKNFFRNGIRYIHNPLGNPRERLMYMVSPKVDFKLIWETDGAGQVHGSQVLRFWEEKGGGLEGLHRRFKIHGRRRPAMRNVTRFII